MNNFESECNATLQKIRSLNSHLKKAKCIDDKAKLYLIIALHYTQLQALVSLNVKISRIRKILLLKQIEMKRHYALSKMDMYLCIKAVLRRDYNAPSNIKNIR